MKIDVSFPGGNALVRDVIGTDVYLEPDVRDTEGWWFYWAVRVSDAGGQTLHFHFPPDCVGYFGGAVSADGEHWRWTGGRDADEKGFSYTFGPEENEAYFCHDMRYPVERFMRFARETGLTAYPFARSRHSREVPAFTAGSGERILLLTSRHHCCESTGSWVLEGAVREYLREPLPGLRLVAVPFMDMDGVSEGDQGKDRRPFDHCMDYDTGVYPETRAMLDFAGTHDVACFLDCHSPWHIGGRNDHVFLSGAYPAEDAHTRRLEPALLEANRRFPGGLEFDPASCVPFYAEWNQDPAPGQESGKRFFAKKPEVFFSGAMETAYFGTPEDPVSIEKLLRVGTRLIWALRETWKK